MTEQSLALRQATALATRGFDDPTRELIRKTVSDARAPLTQDEFDLFIAVCQHTGLNPLLREIYCAKIDGKFTILTGIDGHRRIAQQSRRFRGMAGPLYCGPDGRWTDVWLEATPPVACKVGVYQPGVAEPTWGIAYYKNYKNRRTPTWTQMPEHMLAVRAEAFALRKCFSRELMGVALPEDEGGWGDGALDAGPGALAAGERSPRMSALVEEMDGALAEAEASVRLDGETQMVPEQEATAFEQEQPPTGPRWAGTPLGRQVSALVDALEAAGKKFSLPDDDASDELLQGWISSKRATLGQGKAS